MNYVCTACGRQVSVSGAGSKCACGGLWELEFDPPAFSLDAVDKNEWSMFRYRRFMALEDESWRGITLGEGMTPVIRLDEHVLLKMDYLMPTLSYKDRGAAVLMAHCKSLGIDRVVQDSSGNAGNSIAAYAARAGIACEIFVPEGTSPKKISMIRAHGAVCTIVPGSRDHCAQVCREKMEKEGIFYASHVYNPFFYEGTKTYVYEVFEQLGRIPRHLVPPSPPAPLWRKESPSGSPCGERKSYLWQRNTACALSTRRRTGFFRPGNSSRKKVCTASTPQRPIMRRICTTANASGKRTTA